MYNGNAPPHGGFGRQDSQNFNGPPPFGGAGGGFGNGPAGPHTGGGGAGGFGGGGGAPGGAPGGASGSGTGLGNALFAELRAEGLGDFFSDRSRAVAASEVSQGRPGSFIMRPSSQANCVALTLVRCIESDTIVIRVCFSSTALG